MKLVPSGEYTVLREFSVLTPPAMAICALLDRGWHLGSWKMGKGSFEAELSHSVPPLLRALGWLEARETLDCRIKRTHVFSEKGRAAYRAAPPELIRAGREIARVAMWREVLRRRRKREIEREQKKFEVMLLAKRKKRAPKS